MITILAATTNKNKYREIASLLGNRPILLKSLADFQNYPEVVEDGSTFADNAQKKAQAYSEFSGLPTLADDSGLEVPALNNEPGVRSARYSGPGSTDARNNEFLLKRMCALKGQDRIARFVCSVCYVDTEGSHIFTGVTRGVILHQPRGGAGFGYDPLFYVQELKKTYAELDEQEKNAISHRGKAIKAFLTYLNGKLNF